MKRFKLFAGAAAFLAMGALSACQSDDLKQPEEQQVAETDETRFITVALSAPAAQSRAFENGSTYESKVVRLDFIFYDSNGKPTGKMKTFDQADLNNQFQPNDPSTTPPTPGMNNNGNNVTRFWTSVVPIELVQGQNLPAYVICIVNGQNDLVTKYSMSSMQSLREAVRDEFDDKKGNFTMSNSVYFGKNVLSGLDDQRLCQTPINANSQLFKSEEEAQKVINGTSTIEGATMVDIYVERIAAKVGLNFNATAADVLVYNGEYDKEAEGSKETFNLRFIPEYWFVNSTDKQTFTTKRYGLDNGGTINYRPEFAEINKVLATDNGFTNWNDKGNYRSYWGCGPSYYVNEYPVVSDQVYDPEAGEDGNKDKTNYAVKYYSYNEVAAEAAKDTYTKQAVAATDGKFKASVGETESPGYLYVKESTTAISTINSGVNPPASVASAVIVGRYTVDGNELAANAKIWIDTNDQPTIGTGDNAKKTLGKFYANESALKAALAQRQNVLFSDVEGHKADASVFTIKHPDADTRKELANPNVPGRLVTIQLESIPETPLFMLNTVTGNLEQITAGQLATINAQLVQAGYVSQYAAGHGYFSIPIRHLNFNDTNDFKDGVYQWSTMKVGALGLVRNHVYTINVNSISGLATGVRSDEQPIVPPAQTLRQYVAVRLNILAWNVRNAWDVDL